MTTDNFERTARTAVGSVLLFRESRGGGSHGGHDYEMDKARASRVAAENLDGPALYDLLLDVAKKAAERAEQEAMLQRSHIVHEVRRLAEATDSMTLWRFIEKEDAR